MSVTTPLPDEQRWTFGIGQFENKLLSNWSKSQEYDMYRNRHIASNFICSLLNLIATLGKNNLRCNQLKVISELESSIKMDNIYYVISSNWCSLICRNGISLVHVNRWDWVWRRTTCIASLGLNLLCSLILIY